MGLFVRAFTRQSVIAIAVGVLVAGTPLVVFNFWLSGVIDRQGQEETENSARRAVTFAESRIAQVVSALDGLAARGVDSCGPGHIESMQQAAFVTPVIKEVAIIGPSGRTLCSNHSLGLTGLRRMSSSEPLTGTAAY